MLVLSRKAGEKIQVGEVVIRVLRLTGGNVRIGIEAPTGMQILRGELIDAEKDSEANDAKDP